MLVDGTEREAVPADDRGLAYGDGAFETVAVVAGRPALWSEHCDRLAVACRRFGFYAPSADALLADAERLLASADHPRSGVLKIVVTRGSGGRGYRPPAQPTPRRVVSLLAPPDYPARWWRSGVRVRVCATRLPYRPALAGAKHLNRLEQVLARAEWDDPEIAEGLMLTPQGAVGEGTVTNVFARFGDTLVTPPVADHGVCGVMRGHLLANPPEGVKMVEDTLAPENLATAEEVFLTNSLIGVWPVREIDGLATWSRWPGAERLLVWLTASGAVRDWLREGAQ